MNHDMLLVVTDRMGKAIVTAMALHGSLVSCIAELQKLNYETLPCESNFDCSTISSHSSRMVFCGYKLNTLNLDFGHSAANSVINAGMFRGPGSWRHHSTCRPDGLLRHSVTRTPTAYPALPSQPVVLRGRPASLGFQAVVVVLDFYSCSRHCSWGFCRRGKRHKLDALLANILPCGPRNRVKSCTSPASVFSATAIRMYNDYPFQSPQCAHKLSDH